MKGAAFSDNDWEFVVPSVPSELADPSLLVLVVSPAEYNVIVVVNVGMPSMPVLGGDARVTVPPSESLPIDAFEHEQA